MKRFHTLFRLCLILAMLFVSTIHVSASEMPDVSSIITGEVSSAEVSINARIPDTFEIIIPKLVSIDNAREGIGIVSASGDIAGNKYLNLATDKFISLASSGKDTITGTLSLSSTRFNSEELHEGATANIQITVADATAGEWAGEYTVYVGVSEYVTVDVVAKDTSQNELDASAFVILGMDRDNLVSALVSSEVSSAVTSTDDDVTLVQIKSEALDEIAYVAFEAGDVIKEGDTVVLLCYDESEQAWKYVSADIMTGEGLSLDISSVSPVIFVKEAQDGSLHNHSYSVTEEVAATCESDGHKTYVCECGDTYTEVISGGHQFDDDNTCTVCGSSLVPFTLTRSNYTQTGITSLEGDVVIPETFEYGGTEYIVTSIGYQAFYGCTNLTSVVIPDSVTSIGGSAFHGCNGLTAITIPDSVTAIHKYAFSGCNKLADITIPANVTTIGDYAFERCTSLTSIAIPDSVTSIGPWTFSYCSGITDVTIPASVTCINSAAFYNCNGLTDVYYLGTLADWCNISFPSGSSGNPMAFADNLYINGELLSGELIIPDGVTRVGNCTFMRCKGLTSVTIPDSVTSIGNYAFQSCTGLTSIVVPDSVTSIGNWAFQYCNGLTSVDIPDSVTSIGSNAFDGVFNINYNGSAEGAYWGVKAINGHMLFTLTSSNYTQTGITREGDVVIPKTFEYEGVKYIVTRIDNNAFRGCTNLTSIDLPDSVTYISDYAFENCTGLISVKIPDSVTTISKAAFYNCTGLTSVDIPSLVTTIGTNAFNNVANINYKGTATGSPWGAKSVNGYVEGNLVYSDTTKTCLKAAVGSATNVIIPESVTDIGNYAFSYCKKLINVEIPDSVTHIGNYAFQYCTKLTNIEIPENVTYIGNGAFSHCSSLENVTLPDLITSVSYQMFEYCTNLTSVNIPDTVTNINSSAFYECVNLTNVSIPNCATNIDSYAFRNCTGLASIDLPNSVTSIGTYAFDKVANINYAGAATGSPWGAKAVNGYIEGNFVYSDETKTQLDALINNPTSAVVPDSVTTIDSCAFQGCSNLTSVYIPESVTTITVTDYIYSPFWGLEKCTIYCAASEKQSGWSNYWNYETAYARVGAVYNITLEDYEANYK